MRELRKHPKAEAFIFDLDGTLADSMPVFYIAWRNLLADYGVSLTKELFDEMAGRPMRQCTIMINERFQIDMDQEAVAHKVETELLTHLHLIHPIKPVCDLVREYVGKIPMAIGTGSQRENALKVLNLIGLGDCFDVVVAAEDVIEHKPSPETFLKCAEQLGMNPELCQVFEDAQKGIEAAVNAGMIATDVTEFYEVKIGAELY